MRSRKSFPVAHGDVTVSEINIFYPQAHAFHQAQAAAVKQFRHQPIIAFQMREHGTRFGRRKTTGSFAGRVTRWALSMKSSFRSSTC